MNKAKTILSLTTAAALIATLGVPFALAQGVPASVHANLTTPNAARLTAAETRAAAAIDRTKNSATAEINRRVDALNALSDRIGRMRNVSASDNASLMGEVQSQISALQSLQVQVNADTSTTTLRGDVKSIVDSFRIFALIIPQGALLAAVDRVTTLASAMTTVGGKIQARISALQSTNVDVTAAQTAFTDYQAKIADAQNKAAAAQAEITNLQPDNGVTSIATANASALKDARAKVRAAQQDFVAARKDLTAIIRFLSQHRAATTTATSTAATSTNQ